MTDYDKINYEMTVFRELKSEITYEANLISRRIGWFLSAQAFFLGSVAISADRFKGVVNSVSQGPLIPIIPILAIIICIATFLLVRVAFERADKYRAKLGDHVSRSEDLSYFNVAEGIKANWWTQWLPVPFAIA